MNEIPEHHTAALEYLYKFNQIGDTEDEKFVFWESRYSNGFPTFDNPSKKFAICVFERSWLIEQFPQDFSLP